MTLMENTDEEFCDDCGFIHCICTDDYDDFW